MACTWRVLLGDVRDRLAELEPGSVQCVVTSPPYWGLRDYATDGQLGLEPTPAAYVAALVRVFADVRRVLRDDGVLWLNLGDSYSGLHETGRRDSQQQRAIDGKLVTSKLKTIQQQPRQTGVKAKDLVGIPWRVAFALQADGWYLRSDIIWSKPNPMPESVTDRPTKAHEYVFLLSKCERYYYDAAAISEPMTQDPHAPGNLSCGRLTPDGSLREPGRVWGLNGTRNARSVWTITTQPYPEAHFATFPEALPERCIKAGSRLGDTVLDPFCGSGTTGQVAIQLGRAFIGIELNPTYAELARTRIGGAAPLFAAEAADGPALALFELPFESA